MKEKLGRINKYIRGSVWWLSCDMNPDRNSSIQSKSRPVVVISSDFRGKSTVIEVCSITSVDKKYKCTDINIPFINNVGEVNYIECNQHFTVDISQLKGFIGILPSDTISNMNSGLLIAQGMSDLVDADRTIRDMKSRLDSMTKESSTVSSECIESYLVDICKQFNYMIMESSQKLKELKGLNSSQFTESAQENSENTSVEEGTPKNTRKYIRWTEDNMLEFLCDIENSDMSEEDIMSKWNIPTVKGIKQKESYIKKKINM